MKKIILNLKKIFTVQKIEKIEFAEIFETTTKEKGILNTFEDLHSNNIQMYFFQCNTNYSAKPISFTKKDALALSERLKIQAKNLKD